MLFVEQKKKSGPSSPVLFPILPLPCAQWLLHTSLRTNCPYSQHTVMAFLVFDWAVYRSQHPWVRSLRACLSRRTESCLKVFATNRSLLAHETELPPPPPGFNVPGHRFECSRTFLTLSGFCTPHLGLIVLTATYRDGLPCFRLGSLPLRTLVSAFIAGLPQPTDRVLPQGFRY